MNNSMGKIFVVGMLAVAFAFTAGVDSVTTRRNTTSESPSANTNTTLGCNPNMNCDLDHLPYFCGFRSPPSDNGNLWLRVSNRPDIRHHSGSYLTVSKNRLDPGNTADLTTPPLCPAASVNVSFSYLTVRPGTELHVLTRCQGQGQVLDQRSVVYSYFSSRFFRYEDYTLRACPDFNTTVTFHAVVPHDSVWKTTLALDNIKIYSWNGTIPTTPPPTLRPSPTAQQATTTTTTIPTTPKSPSANTTTTPGCNAIVKCNLDNPPSFCGFRGSSGRNRNLWFRMKTNPDIRHNSGYYFTVSKSQRDPGNTADLTTTPLCPAASVNVSFSYLTVMPGTELHVLTRCQDQGQVLDQRSVVYSYFSSRFFRYKDYTLRGCADFNTTVTFQAVVPRDSFRKTTVALDNIYIYSWNRTIPTTPPPTLTPSPTAQQATTTTTTLTSQSPSLKPFSLSYLTAVWVAVSLWLFLRM